MTEKKFLNLKEASEISGYAPDYIGQLIRKGKLEGKQVYSGVAWVTTEDALKMYLRGAQGNKNGKSRASITFGYLGNLKRSIFNERLLRAPLYATVVIAIFIGFVFFYLLSVKIERFLEQRSIRQIESMHTT